MLFKCFTLLGLLLSTGLTVLPIYAQTAELQPTDVIDPGLQLAANPPMQFITRMPTPLPEPTEDFEVREGFTLVETLDEFRAVIKQDNQKIRMKPGIYRPTEVDPPIEFKRLRPNDNPINKQQHIFAVTGSNNYFDLRGVVFETALTTQAKLPGTPHVSDCWHINGANNTFEGGYFHNILDKTYPDYRVTDNEFEICNDGNTFLDCTIVTRGSIPYGYTDYYGKGNPNFGFVDKHCAISFEHANNTTLIGCKIYMQSFGHALHFHKVDGVLIKDCLISGTLRPSRDIYREKAGRAKEYKFRAKYRTDRPIPRDEVIPLVEDGVRSYNEVKNITVIDTVVERMRGSFQLLCEGDITLENVTVLESGDFSFDLSAGKKGKVVMKNCKADLAYNPIFNLTRGDLPYQAFYEVTILSPADGIRPTPRTGLGVICGEDSTFILHDAMTRRLPTAVNTLTCGGRKPLKNSTVTNYTRARLILEKNVTNCVIKSVGKVVDRGTGNTIIRLRPGTTAESAETPS